MGKKQIASISVVILILIILLGIWMNKSQKKNNEENNRVNENIIAIDDSEIFQKKERNVPSSSDIKRMRE